MPRSKVSDETMIQPLTSSGHERVVGQPSSLDRTILEQIDPANLVPGGVDTCIHDLVKYAENAVISIVGITADPHAPLGRWQEIEFAGKVIDFLPVALVNRADTVGLVSKLPHSLRIAAGAWRYRREIDRTRIQTHRVELGFVAQTLLRCRSSVQFIHNDGNGLTGRNSDSLWKKFPYIYRQLEKVVLKRASTVVLFNRTDAERVRAMRPDTFVTTTWFDPDLYYYVEDETDARSGDLKICWIGRFEEQKDPLLAIDSLSELSKLGVAFTATMIGDGRLKNAVQSRVESLGLGDKVSLTGALLRSEVADQLRNNSVLLMTSHYEGSPRVMAEALACGVPVVATQGADTDQIIERGVNGERVADRSARNLAKALSRVKETRAKCAESVADRSAPAAVKRLIEL